MQHIVRSKGFKVALIALGLTAGAAIAWIVLALRPSDPDQIASQTKTALETGNVGKLLELASTDEVRTLNLNEQNVRAFLKDTLWKDGLVKLQTRRIDSVESSEINYLVECSDKKAADLRFPVIFNVMKFPGIFGTKKNYLALGQSLFEISTGVKKPAGDVMSMSEMGYYFWTLAQNHDIYGLWDTRHGYTFSPKYKRDHPVNP